MTAAPGGMSWLGWQRPRWNRKHFSPTPTAHAGARRPHASRNRAHGQEVQAHAVAIQCLAPVPSISPSPSLARRTGLPPPPLYPITPVHAEDPGRRPAPTAAAHTGARPHRRRPQQAEGMVRTSSHRMDERGNALRPLSAIPSLRCVRVDVSGGGVVVAGNSVTGAAPSRPRGRCRHPRDPGLGSRAPGTAALGASAFGAHTRLLCLCLG